MKLQVVEGCNGFYLYLNGDEDCRGMGGGVDEEFEGLTMGDEGFVEAWQREVDRNLDEYLEAYFPFAHGGGVYEEALDGTD